MMGLEDMDALLQEGNLAMRESRFEDARRLFAEALAAAEARQPVQRVDLVRALNGSLRANYFCGMEAVDWDPSAVSHEMERRLDALAEEGGIPDHIRVRAWEQAGTSAGHYDRCGDSCKYFEAALQLRREVGIAHDALSLFTRQMLIFALQQGGKHDRALELSDESIGIIHGDVAFSKYLSWHLYSKGRSLLLTGRFEEASAILQEAQGLRSPADLKAEIDAWASAAERRVRCMMSRDGALIEVDAGSTPEVP